ncbi:MAG: hypothetical protein ACXV3D_02975 [Halobacteriota archaeon]
MKRTVLSIALVAVMALTVVSTAGVLAAPKAAAQEPIEPIIIQYQAGKTYTFTPNQYNVHSAQFTPYVGTPVHNEFANGGTAFAMIHDKAEAGDGETNLGTLFQLDGGYDAWTTVWNKPCKVTVTVDYTLVAKGDANTRAGVMAYIVNPHGVQDARQVTVLGNDKTAVKTGTLTLEHTGIVDDILHYVMADPSLVQGAAYTQTFVGQNGNNPVATTGHASANAHTSSITISFL